MQPQHHALPKPFLKWVGGKRQLLPDLINAIRAAPSFRRFHEPFLGGGALFFELARTNQLPSISFLSDANPNLIEAYIGVRDSLKDVISCLRRHQRKHCEEYYYSVRSAKPRTVAARAARIIYLNRTCYNGLYRENSRGEFNAPYGRYKNPKICDEDNLEAVSRTLRTANLKAQHFASACNQTRVDDLVYFDPPYAPTSKTADFTSYTKNGFGAAEQLELARTCRRLADAGVQIIVSNSMTEQIQEIYRDFYIHEVFAKRLVNSRADRRGKVSEALITSFELESSLPQNVVVQVNTRSIRKDQDSSAKQWLRKNGYADVADRIEEITREWNNAGKNTRRNWWQVLCGTSSGKPCVVAGRSFPVLRAAQLRQGIRATENAISRNPSEITPRSRKRRT